MALLEESLNNRHLVVQVPSYVPIVALVVGYLLYLGLNCIRKRSSWKKLPMKFIMKWGFVGVPSWLVIRVYTVGYTPANTSGRNHSEQWPIRQIPLEAILWCGTPNICRATFFYVEWACPGLREIFGLSYLSFYFWLFYERIMFTGRSNF